MSNYRQPRVLMLGWEFPPEINGGLGVACHGLAKALSRAGVQLEIIVPRAKSSHKKFRLTGLSSGKKKPTIESVGSRFCMFTPVEQISIELNPYQLLISENRTLLDSIEQRQTGDSLRSAVDLFSDGDLYDENLEARVVAYTKRVVGMALSRDFDLIHAHDWMTFLAGIEIKKITGKPLILHVHSTEFDRAGGIKKNWIYQIERHGVTEADAVIPVSRYTGEILRYHYGVYPGKVFPVHNGIDPLREKISKKRNLKNPIVLFAGRLTGQKGPRYFLEMARLLSKRNSEISFVIVGTGHEEKALADYARALGIGKRVSFVGFVPHEEVRDYYNKASVYCMPSVSDPFGLTALEAAQCKVPGVLSKQAGVTEVLGGALTTDYWDTELMARHAEALLVDRELRKKILKRAKKDLKKLKWKNSAVRVCDVYEVVLSGKLN